MDDPEDETAARYDAHLRTTWEHTHLGTAAVVPRSLAQPKPSRETPPERPGEHYLGDSVTVRREDSVAILARDFSDGRRHEIRLDPAVLDEFLTWVEDMDPPVWRAERV